MQKYRTSGSSKLQQLTLWAIYSMAHISSLLITLVTHGHNIYGLCMWHEGWYGSHIVSPPAMSERQGWGLAMAAIWSLMSHTQAIDIVQIDLMNHVRKMIALLDLMNLKLVVRCHLHICFWSKWRWTLSFKFTTYIAQKKKLSAPKQANYFLSMWEKSEHLGKYGKLQ